jgi:hypothetical protein
VLRQLLDNSFDVLLEFTWHIQGLRRWLRVLHSLGLEPLLRSLDLHILVVEGHVLFD